MSGPAKGVFTSLPHFLVRKLVNSLGFEIRRMPRKSEAGTGASQRLHPVTCQYLRRPGIVDVELDLARGLFAMGLPLQGATHPFVRGAVIARERGTGPESASLLRNVLVSYYTSVRPRMALDVVDLTEVEAPGLVGVPAFGWVYPWSEKTTAQAITGRNRAMRLDALQYGRILSAEEGITAFGPVGPKKLDLEVARILALVRSFADNGFQPFDRGNPLQVTTLQRERTYRWLVEAGHHRFAVCSAFSIDSVPAVQLNLVRREDCEHWPQVASGIFRPEGALKFFDRLFDGGPARICTDWIRGRNEQATTALWDAGSERGTGDDCGMPAAGRGRQAFRKGQRSMNAGRRGL